MAYTPGAVPSDPAALPGFLRSEFQRIAEAAQARADIVRLSQVSVAPAKPRSGDVRYADGINWNPSEGAGFYYFDGTSWHPFDVAYDVGCYIAGKPSASEILLRFVTPRAFTLPASLTGSKGSAATAATAQTDFDVKKNASSIGTVRFAAAGTTSTFIAASAATFAAGDVLSVVAPVTPDATLADISITLKASR